MATLRAAAFILNGALILLVLFQLSSTNHVKPNPDEILMVAVISATPIVNIITLALQGRVRS